MAVEFAPDDYRKFELDWYEAKLYCFSLNIDGKVGWRLPTIDEIIEEDWGLCKDDFSVWVWTSDPVNNVSNSQRYAYQYDLCDGELFTLDKTTPQEVWVYPVRDLKDD